MDEFGDRLIVTEPHVWQDGLQTDWGNDRASFYRIGGVPTVMFDGKYSALGASDCEWAASRYCGYISQRLSETDGLSPVEIVGHCYCAQGEASLVATFTLLDPVAPAETSAFLVLLEDSIYYDDPDMGPDIYDHVVRAAYEEPVTLADPGDAVEVATQIWIDPEWAPENFDAIAFLQRMDGDLEVYQAGRLTMLYDPVGDIAIDTDGQFREDGSRIWAIEPNPLPMSRQRRATVRLWVSEAGSSGPLRLDVFDARGRLVRTILQETLPPGTWPVCWDGRRANGQPADAGCYFLQLAACDGVDAARILVLR